MRALAWKYMSVYWCIGLLVAALLVALGFTPLALTNSASHAGAGDGTVAAVMGRGGQLEKQLLW
jgi:ABC-type uncharacterized transport system permease subunit